MSLLESVFSVALGVSAVFATLLAVDGVVRDETREQRLFAGVMGFVAVFASGKLLQVVATDEAGSLLGTKLLFTGTAGSVFFLVLFTLSYTDRGDLVTPWTVAALSVEAVLLTGLVWTMEYHSLLWSEVAFDPTAVTELSFVPTPLLFVHVVYTYLAMTGATLLLIRTFLQTRELYRLQIVGIVPAVTLPLVLNTSYFFGLLPVDATPAGFAVTGMAIWVSKNRFDFGQVTPVARQRVVEKVDQGVYVLDGNDRIVDVNPRGAELLGVEAEQAIGNHASEVFDDPNLYERYQSVFDAKEEVSIDTPGGMRTFVVDVSPLRDPGDDHVGRVFVVRDVTERRERERELERQNEQLDEFASVVSHDLRNPLNVAEGYVELLDVDEDQRPKLEEISESHDRMRRIIEDVLTMAREGQTVSDPEVLSLSGIVEEAWSNVDTGGATLTDRTDRTVEGDRSRLLHVFENLFRNSVEHGGETVAIEVGPIDDREGGVVDPDAVGIYVEDDGPGIPPAERDDVFDAGYTTAETGTGLGLSIVRSFVEAHGWTIRATESRDGGARFEVRGVTDVTAEVADRESDPTLAE